MRNQTIPGDAKLNPVAEGANRIVATLATNFLGSAAVETGGVGAILFGSIMPLDEAMVVFTPKPRRHFAIQLRSASVNVFLGRVLGHLGTRALGGFN